MKEEMYTQCRLKKGTKEQMSWIPGEFAVAGKVVKLKDADTGNWDDGWIVEAAYSSRTWEEVNLASQTYKKHRKHTDI
jgi:hypothetical protein